jgi:sugar phosphate isomerase/epimerase
MNFQQNSRRTFLKNSALATAGATLTGQWSHLFDGPPPTHIGLQLYSLRDDIGKDPVKTTEAVAKMGYKEVEGYGMEPDKIFKMPLADYAKVLKDNGLKMPSTHASITIADYDSAANSINDRTKKLIDAAAGLGLRYLTVPYMNADDRTNMAKVVKTFQSAAAYCAKAGIKLAYHNHDFEYKQQGPDGRLIIEWLLHEIDPKQMDMEMDMYWVVFAGHNPADWFRLYPNRWRLCHAKDMANTEKRQSIEVGDGTIDFKKLFRQSSLAGLQYYIVELEHYQTTPLEGANKARKGLIQAF